MDWPPTEQAFLNALPSEESALFEFKRQWYDLRAGRGKAEFAKDILAIANTVSPSTPGYLVVGIDDPGNNIVGIEEPPNQEQLHQVLVTYTNPCPSFECAAVTVAGKLVSVLRVSWTSAQPYYATRDCDGVLDSRLVYARRGPTVGVLRPPEVAELLQNRQGRTHVDEKHPLHVGFVEDGREFGKVVLRIVNVTEELLDGITIIWDLHMPGRNQFYRSRSYYSLALKGGEARETEYKPRQQLFQVEGKRLSDSPYVIDRWFDLTAHVQYRDREGFIQDIKRTLAVEI